MHFPQAWGLIVCTPLVASKWGFNGVLYTEQHNTPLTGKTNASKEWDGQKENNRKMHLVKHDPDALHVTSPGMQPHFDGIDFLWEPM